MAIAKSELIAALKSLSREEWKEIDSTKEAQFAKSQEELNLEKQQIFEKHLALLSNICQKKYSWTLGQDFQLSELETKIADWFSENKSKLREFLGSDEKITQKKDIILRKINEFDGDKRTFAVITFLKLLKSYPV